MAENEVVRVIRVRGVPEGMENLTAQLHRAEQAYSGVGTAASSSGTATETSARKLNTTERAYRSLTERLDSTARVYRQLQNDTKTLSGAFDAGFMGKGAEAASRFNSELLAVRHSLQDVGGKLATGNAGLDKAFGIGEAPTNLAKDVASAFSRGLEDAEHAAAEKAKLIAKGFWQNFDQQFASSGNSARASAGAFERYFAPIDAEIAARKATTMGKSFYQNHINDSVGISDRLNRYTKGSAEDSFGAITERDSERVRQLRAEYNPLSEAIRKNSERIQEYQQLVERGSMAQEEFGHAVAFSNRQFDLTKRSIDGTNVAMGKYASGAGLARHELVNLSRQAQDVFVSLASGQAPMTVLIQQGTQIADVFASAQGSVGGFLRQAARGVAGFAMSGLGALTGGALVGGVAIAAGLQYANSQREIERSMAGVGRQSGITSGQIERMSSAYASAAKVSTATAREMLTAFASTGKFGAGLLPGTASLTKDFAAQFGLTASEAAKQLAGAFVDPTRGAQELNKQLGFLDAKTLEYIRTMQAQGRIGDAQKALADGLGQSVQGAADRTNGLARAWNSVWSAASRAWDALGKATGGQDTLEDRLARLIEARRQAESRRSRFALPSALSQYDSGISDVQEQIRRRNQQADRDARTARESAASTGALSVLDDLNPFSAELRKLETMASALKKGLEEAGAALSPDQVRATAEAYERIQKAIQLALPPAERQKQINDLTVQSIMARTVAERAAAEVARLQIDSAFKLKETDEQRLIILGKIAEVQAQATRGMQDANRAAKDSASLAGLLPYQRALKQIEIDTRNRTEQFGTSGVGAGAALPQAGALPATEGALRGLDTAFAANLKKLMQEFPGLTVTSGMRSTEQQARLYAEKGPGWAARPNTSNHEQLGGMPARAADLAYNGKSRLPDEIYKRASELGVGFPLKDRAVKPEPWHAEPATPRAGGPANDNAGLNKSTAALAEYTLKVEQVAGPLRDANMALDAQIVLTQRQAETMFMSTGEIAKVAEAQRLTNEYMRAGVPITDELRAGIDAYATRAGAAAEYIKSVGEAQKALGDLNSLGKDAFKGFLSDIRAGKSGAEAFSNSLNKIADKLIDMAINDLFSKAFGGNGSGSGFMGLLGKAFGGLGGGSAPLALSSGTGGLYADGGYTGRGGKNDPAGIVHRGEYVFSAASVSRIGLGRLDSMHRGGLPGYAAGGYVSPTPYAHQPAANSNASTVNVQVVNRTTGEVEGTATTRQNPDGSLDVLVDLVEARMAGKVVRQQGSMSTAMRAVDTNRQLRG